MSISPELLTSLSVGELEALAEGLLAPGASTRLDELLSRNADGALSPEEFVELDRLLNLADQLTILKTRALHPQPAENGNCGVMTAYIPITLKRRVRDRFGDRCAYCQTAEILIATRFEIEHIAPRSVGGETAFGNLCLSCPMCNRYKSNSLSAIDPETQTSVPLFHPQLQDWTAHFAWSKDATEIVGLSPTGRATIMALRMNRPAMIRVRRMWVAMAEHPPTLE